jgi:hypothetical protein
MRWPSPPTRQSPVASIVTALRDDFAIRGRLHSTGVTGNRPVERVLALPGMRVLSSTSTATSRPCSSPSSLC